MRKTPKFPQNLYENPKVMYRPLVALRKEIYLVFHFAKQSLVALC